MILLCTLHNVHNVGDFYVGQVVEQSREVI